ncbi:glycosyltransferase family 4 protein [Pelagibacterales bacterium SAG-MED22]|nr:glycosyltransferase family 4 protein [Pelagibacterales bacterium SAG-MED22]
MRVNISVFGRFFAFDLAKQLDEAGILNKLITTYPKFKVEEWGIDANKVVSELPLEILNRLNQRSNLNSNWFNSYLKIIHAKNSVKYLDGCDIFIGFSNSSLETLVEAKKRGIITVLERASAHYSYQQNILMDEFKKQNLKFHPNHYSWKRELAEYDITNYISIGSSFVKKSFIHHGVPEEKLIVNSLGVDFKSFSQIPKKDKIFRIIYAGSGTIQKGYHYLLQAFYELNLSNCELWHLGNLSKDIKPFLKKYKHPNWIFKGHQPQKELYKFYSQGNVFVFPSLQDGFGMVVPQAMACGLPVVCTTNTGAGDLIMDGEEGFVIPTQNVEKIKEKINYLYSNRDKCNEMGQKAKKKVSTNFTWDDYGKRYINNLKEIIKFK